MSRFNMSIRYTPLSRVELDVAALDHFVRGPVTHDMISYLATAAHNVIQCDSNANLPMAAHPQAHSTTPGVSHCDAGNLPSLEVFIAQLVRRSGVMVPTLMSSLVYLNRLRSRLQPMAKGLRSTTHRIFLASLILAAKYLNDSSPRNKHWAQYTHIDTLSYSFGFSRTEVNLMEKQLLFLLDWNLSIKEDDLTRELDAFLSPIRTDIIASHASRFHRKRESERKRKAVGADWTSASAAVYATPPPLRAHSHSVRQDSPDSLPELCYSGSSSSSVFTSKSSSSSRSTSRSRSDTCSSIPEPATPVYNGGGNAYESPVEVLLDSVNTVSHMTEDSPGRKKMLPYEISCDELQDLHEGYNRVKRVKNMFGRVFGASTMSVRV